MSYTFWGIVLVFVLACIVMGETYWSNIRAKMNFIHSFGQSIIAGGVFITYAAVDYFVIVFGANNLLA